MKTTFTLLFLLLFSSDTYAQEYVINGTVTGFPENSWIYLSDLSDGSYKKIDSAKIINEKISLKGRLPSKIIFSSLHTKDFQDRVKFWLDENENMVYLKKDDFPNAKIKGSKTQRKFEELIKNIENVENPNNVIIKFINNNPNSILSSDQLYSLRNSISKDSVKILYNRLTPEAKSSIYGQNISNFLTFSKSIEIGNRYEDFEQKDIDGKSIKLSDYKNKIILLDFWGSWCAPCREGHLKQIEIYNKFKTNGFEILGVGAETKKEQFEKAIKNDNLPWVNVSDFKGDKNIVAIIYGVTYYPSNYLIDKSGIIIAKDLHGEDLERKLEEIFK